jgi:hypothetical protein
MLKRCISGNAVAQHAVDEVRLFQSVAQPGWRDAFSVLADRIRQG